MLTNKNVGLGLGLGLLVVALIGFQNCSKTNFSSADGAGNMKMASQGTENGDDGVTTDDEDTTAQNDDNNDNESDSVGDSSQVADLVECQLGSPNAKIVLNEDFKIGSNNSATRICMSKKSCLETFNAYAAARNCTLASGAPTTQAPQGTQCTQIFPGSKGTCHNAKVLQDAEVEAMLTEMAK